MSVHTGRHRLLIGASALVDDLAHFIMSDQLLKHLLLVLELVLVLVFVLVIVLVD